MKKTALALALALGLVTTTGCTQQQNVVQSGNCITVVVDFQSLKSDKTQTCVASGSAMKAMMAFNLAGYSISGTDKYGLQIICRVNGYPTAKQVLADNHKDYREKCTDMPADFAYWALLIKTPKQDWTFAPVGVADLELNPGEQVALVFSVNEKMVLPN